jgi:hypothetical protein
MGPDAQGSDSSGPSPPRLRIQPDQSSMRHKIPGKHAKNSPSRGACGTRSRSLRTTKSAHTIDKDGQLRFATVNRKRRLGCLFLKSPGKDSGPIPIAKVRVAGSNPVVRSKLQCRPEDRNGGVDVRLIEALQDPVTFNDSHFSGHVILSSRAALSGQPLTFTSGAIMLPRSDDLKGPDPRASP